MQLNMLIIEESYMGLALMEDHPHETLGQESTELSSRFFLWQFKNLWAEGVTVNLESWKASWRRGDLMVPNFYWACFIGLLIW